jgi:hypothetical protein
MSIEQRRPLEEKVTYNAEIYVYEGKAPSVELRGVFDRLAAWMRRVYKSIRDDLNAIYRREFGTDLPILTPEVRSVFDRMLASEEQIKRQEAIEAQRRRGMMIQEGIKQAGGVLKGLFGGRSGGRAASEDTVTITEGGGDTGKPRVSRKMSPEEYDAYEKRNKEAAAAAAMEQQDAPIQAALDEIQRMKAMGITPSITRDANGNPKVIDSMFFGTTVTDAMEQALEAQLKNPKRSVPLRVVMPQP